jgi:hypothetical protein
MPLRHRSEPQQSEEVAQVPPWLLQSVDVQRKTEQTPLQQPLPVRQAVTGIPHVLGLQAPWKQMRPPQQSVLPAQAPSC